MPGADETLEVEARLLDRLTPAIQQMGKKVKDGFDGMANRAQAAQSKMGKAFKGFSSGITDFAKRFGPAAIAVAVLSKATQALGQAIDFVNEKTKEFEKTMSTVAAILRPTTAEMSALSEQARMLGETTAFSASEAGDAFVELGKLGFQANQIIDASADVLNLAAVASVEMSVAAEVTAKTLGQFGLKASDATSVVDIMAKSFNISALDIDKFKESMKFAGATANKVGIDLQGTTAALAQLAKSGIEGSQAGTALRRIMLELSDANSKAGKQVGFAVKNMDDFQRALTVLQSKNLSAGQIKDTFGLLSSTAAGILIDGVDNIGEFDKKLRDAQGTAQDFAATMLDNVAGATKILESAQEGLGLAIGEAFGPAKRKRIESYTERISFVTSVVKAHQREIEVVANFISGAFLLAMDAVGFVLRGLVASWELLDGAVAKAMQGFAKFGQLAARVLNKLGADIDLTFLDTAVSTFGEEAEISFERARAAAEGIDLAGVVKEQIEKSKEEIRSVGDADESALEKMLGLTQEQEDAAKKKAEQFIKDVKALETSVLQDTHAGRLELLAQQRAELLEQAKEGSAEEAVIRQAFQKKVEKEILKNQAKNFKLQKNEVARKQALRKQDDADTKRQIANQKALTNARLSAASSVVGSMSTILQLTVKNEKRQKKIALGAAIIQGGLAMMKAIASAPFPANLPAVIATGAASAAQIATISTQAFANGGLPVGRNANIMVNERGQEAVLNAQATASLGSGAINRLNNGGSVANTVTNEISYSPTITLGQGSREDFIDLLKDDKEDFANFIQEDLINKGFLQIAG